MQKLLIKQVGDTMQNGGAFKRRLYRGQKPGLIAKFLNRMWANAASRNAMSNGLVALEVIGRKSGRVVSFPLVLVTLDRQRIVIRDTLTNPLMGSLLILVSRVFLNQTL